jgi:hypothetical protein
MDWRLWVPKERPSHVHSVLVGVTAFIFGAVVRVPLQLTLGDDLPFVTYFPLLLGAAIWGGLQRAWLPRPKLRSLHCAGPDPQR